jgi:hypothetical protein
VPLRPWRSPTSQEIRELVTLSKPHDIHRSVMIVRLSQELIQVLRQLTTEEINTIFGSLDINNDMQRLMLSYIEPVCTLDGIVAFHRLVPDRPNRLTVSYDHMQSAFNGLHVDSWDSPPGHDRNRSPNRISINVGTVERKLLFVNVTLDEMGQQIKEASPDVAMPCGTERGRLFFRMFPHYPVASLRLLPGEAYIAPTENMMHDGSSERIDDTTWQLTIRGYINVK